MGENSWNGFERNCLFVNRGEGRFVDVGRATGSDARWDSRGVAKADLDHDGRVDLVIANNDAPPTILMNRLATVGHWVELELRGTRSNRDAVGARVTLTVGGRKMVRTVEAGSGYSAQSAHPLHFGLGDTPEIEALEILWPSGLEQRLEGAELAAEVRPDERVLLVEPGDSLAQARAGASGRQG